MRGAEALLRVRHPAWGILPPAYFAPEGSGSVDAVSDAVISRAVEEASFLRAERADRDRDQLADRRSDRSRGAWPVV
ncbi:MAG TPA: hypothetical protein VHI74_01100 [Methyloceanibacter sp.]|nr:hypothetical protein [Methyloceanibacter sp.]